MEALADEMVRLGYRRAFIDHPFSEVFEFDVPKMQRWADAGIRFALTWDLDLAGVTVDVLINGDHQERARGAEVLGTPVAPIAWLAGKLAEFGWCLEAGMRVMSGSFTRQYGLAAGDRVESRFESIGAVRADFR